MPTCTRPHGGPRGRSQSWSTCRSPPTVLQARSGSCHTCWFVTRWIRVVRVPTCFSMAATPAQSPTHCPNLFTMAYPLAGTLPPEWADEGSFPSLSSLYLNKNMFSGTLPPEWGSNESAAFPSLQLVRIGSATAPHCSPWRLAQQFCPCTNGCALAAFLGPLICQTQFCSFTPALHLKRAPGKSSYSQRNVTVPMPLQHGR